jgi:hypothetical protein
MAKVVVTVPGERVVEEFTALVRQTSLPSPLAPPPGIGLVEISQSTPTELIPGPMGPQGPRGTRWTNGDGPPTSSTGNVLGDLYVDDVTGDVWQWDGDSWELTGTNIQGSPDTPAQVLAKLIQVDGAGSGLDADTLDGHDTPYFATQTDMTAVQGVNTTQDNRLTSVENVNTAQGSNLTTINADQVTQNNRMTTIEAKNTTQDADIAARLTDAPSDGNTWGRLNGAWAEVGGGAGGGTTSYEYTFNVNTTEPPGSGTLRLNNANQTLATIMWPHGTSAPGADVINGLRQIKAGSVVYIQDKDNSAAWQEYNVTADAIVETGYVEIGIAWTKGGTAVPAQRILLGVSGGGGGGAATFIGDNPPASPLAGQLWWESDTGLLFLRYTDVNSSQFVQVGGTVAASMPTTVVHTTSIAGVAIPAGARLFSVKGVGGGAAGGGVNSAGGGAGLASSGGGGGSGCYGESSIAAVAGATTYDVTIGAGGVGVSAAAGGGGGATIVAVGSSSVTFNGGIGGGAGSVSAAVIAWIPGAGGAFAASGSIVMVAYGSMGKTGISGPSSSTSGAGGESPWGRGGAVDRVASAAANIGNAGVGYGAGGASAVNYASSNSRAGGDGAPGRVEITFFY